MVGGVFSLFAPAPEQQQQPPVQQQRSASGRSPRRHRSRSRHT
jgi:hypothetical protein